MGAKTECVIAHIKGVCRGALFYHKFHLLSPERLGCDEADDYSHRLDQEGYCLRMIRLNRRF